MLRRNTQYAFAAVGGLLLFAAGLSSSATPRPGTGIPQRRDERKVPALVWAEPPSRDPALRFQLKGHKTEIKALALVPKGSRLLTLDCTPDLCCWDLKSGVEEYTIALRQVGQGTDSIENRTSYHSPLAVSLDGRFAAVCGLEANVGVVQIYDIREKKKVHEFKPTAQFGGAFSLAFSTRGDRLALALHGAGALQWSLSDAKSLTPEKSAALPLNPKNENWAWSVTHLRGDDVLAVGLIGRTIAFYNAQRGDELGRFLITTQDEKLWRFPPYQLALSTDGGLLLAVARREYTLKDPDNMIHLWDMATGEKVWTFTHKELQVGQAALSPDGRYVAVGFFNDPTVRLYRISDSKEIAAFQGHTKGVTCIAFSADGKFIASGGLDHTAIVWAVKEGLLPPAEQPKADKDFAKAWDTLRDGKPLEALEATAALAAAKDDAVTWISGKLSPARKPDAARVQKLLAQLDDDDPDKRDAASRELGAWGAQVEAAVKKALEDKPLPEPKRRLEELLKEMRPLWVRDRDTVRAVRAVYVLERVGSERAVKLLKKLAEGEPAARLTREAKISLERIEVRKPPKDK